MLVRTQDLLVAAMEAPNPYGVLAFNVIGLEHAEAIVCGAEAERSPVILQLSENAIRYRMGALEPITAACRELAVTARVPVALHLDHATSHGICVRAVNAGMSSIMFDASALAFRSNIEATFREASWAHDAGLTIEGELGIVGGKGGSVSMAEQMTDPREAVEYVRKTTVDSLAVAVGTKHGMTSRSATLDFQRIEALCSAVEVPLVLHGSSGVADQDLAEAVHRGIVKINIATQINVAFTEAIRRYLAEDAHVTDPRQYGEVGRAAITGVVRSKLHLVGAAGKA